MELKRERELRGISLQEISDATKINIRYLRELEENRLDTLPGKFFIKGIIRSYAKYMGLEEDAVLNSYYESELHREKEQEIEPGEKEVRSALPVKIKKILLSVSLFLVLMSVLTVVYILIYQKPQVQQVEETPLTSVPQAIPTSPPAEETLVEKDTELILSLSFQMETWIQVFADGELIIDGIKQPGEEAQVRAQMELLIHTGNAGGLTFQLNGKPGKPLGSSGEVVRDIRITLENMEEFIEKEEENATV